jgi:hypothetical protein
LENSNKRSNPWRLMTGHCRNKGKKCRDQYNVAVPFTYL